MNLKKIDFIFFTVLAIVAELISSISFSKLHSGFYFSFSILIFIIYSLRWGKSAIITLVLSGIPLLFTQPIGNVLGIEIWKGILYHMLVNVFAVIPIWIYGNRNRNKIIANPTLLALYVFCVFVSLSIGKEIALLIISRDPLGGIKYFVSQIFTLVLTILILLILLRLKTKLICDMTEYLKEAKEEICMNENMEKGESETSEHNSDETRENQEYLS